METKKSERLRMMEKVMLLKTEKLVHHVVQESSWLNIGTDIIVDYVIPPLRWMLKLSKRTSKS